MYAGSWYPHPSKHRILSWWRIYEQRDVSPIGTSKTSGGMCPRASKSVGISFHSQWALRHHLLTVWKFYNLEDR